MYTDSCMPTCPLGNPRVFLIIGLPGSGKTAFINSNTERFGSALDCDDYYKHAPPGNVGIRRSRYFDALMQAFRARQSVIVSEIVFCRETALAEFERELSVALGGLGVSASIERIYFENDPQACIANVRRRARPEREEWEVAYILQTSPNYHIPADAIVVPVYRPPQA